MISPNAMDNNRSKDVAGPELKRPYDVELKMKESSNQTNVLEKCPLSSLHCGDQEAPLVGLGEQQVVVSQSMGSASASPKAMTSKGKTKDEAHHGKS